ncbi:hypothetical protein J1782_24090 [Rahnella sp. BCC 1045]|uniref:hypothetical protein n=1 Tax=Rahnella sp. BCC 1045 TaxID=2816251 RepID=UPI001C26156F|nr:hypothetical protein [Rahnella sp. BCC 1045]MBU9822977.1 hypothetical protein [Rahnella sp. BCC 1045]
MNLNVTSLLSRLTLEQDDKLSALLSAAATESKKSGDPLAVRFKPGIREYVTQASAKLGVSASEFINILIEGVVRETLSPFQTRATLVVERFQLLMGAHGLNVTDVATLLSPWNIGLSVLENRERTMDYLTAPLLSEMADWFGVNKGWLQGEVVTPGPAPGNIPDWHTLALRINKEIRAFSGIGLPQIILLRDKLAPPVDKRSHETLIGVCLITARLKNGVPLRIVQYLGEQIPYGGHEELISDFLAYCGVIERKGLARVATRTTDTTTLSLLSSGKVLPIMAVDKIFNSTDLSEWQTEELLPLRFPEKYATQEWLKTIDDML